MDMEQTIKKIIEMLTAYSAAITSENKLNFTDQSVISEYFYANIVNILFGYHLGNMNEKVKNYPGIDLAGEGRKIAFQITANGTKKKVRDTWEQTKPDDKDKYKIIIVFRIINRNNCAAFDDTDYTPLSRKYCRHNDFVTVSRNDLEDILPGKTYELLLKSKCLRFDGDNAILCRSDGDAKELKKIQNMISFTIETGVIFVVWDLDTLFEKMLGKLIGDYNRITALYDFILRWSGVRTFEQGAGEAFGQLFSLLQVNAWKSYRDDLCQNDEPCFRKEFVDNIDDVKKNLKTLRSDLIMFDGGVQKAILSLHDVLRGFSFLSKYFIYDHGGYCRLQEKHYLFESFSSELKWNWDRLKFLDTTQDIREQKYKHIKYLAKAAFFELAKIVNRVIACHPKLYFSQVQLDYFCPTPNDCQDGFVYQPETDFLEWDGFEDYVMMYENPAKDTPRPSGIWDALENFVLRSVNPVSFCLRAAIRRNGIQETKTGNPNFIEWVFKNKLASEMYHNSPSTPIRPPEITGERLNAVFKSLQKFVENNNMGFMIYLDPPPSENCSVVPPIGFWRKCGLCMTPLPHIGIKTAGSEHFPADLLARLPGLLVPWFLREKRDLEWRNDPTPYRVWISEIMLQQTRVEAVKPYYDRFLAELPDVAALASVDETRLLKLWEGLGYYRRARNLQAAAKKIMQDYGGVFPDGYDEVRGLPGIGDYTAGAILSIAFGKPFPAVDGNVLRVATRLAACREDIDSPKTRKELTAALAAVYPAGQCSEFTQSLMELGATVCLPNGAPLCAKCPLAGICLASQQGITDEIPVRKGKAVRPVKQFAVVVLRDAAGRFAVRRRPETGLLAGLYEFPNLEVEGLPEENLLKTMFHASSIKQTGTAKHIFTHMEWDMTLYLAETNDPPDGFEWVTRSELRSETAIPSAFRAAFQLALDAASLPEG